LPARLAHQIHDQVPGASPSTRLPARCRRVCRRAVASSAAAASAPGTLPRTSPAPRAGARRPRRDRGHRGVDAREVRRLRWTAGMAREWQRSHLVPPPPFGPWVRGAGAVRGRLRGRCGGGAGAVVGRLRWQLRGRLRWRGPSRRCRCGACPARWHRRS
jgi:hypothetical protein